MKWRQDIEIALGLTDFYLALREKEPVKHADHAPANKKNECEWIKVNMMVFLVIKKSISNLV